MLLGLWRGSIGICRSLGEERKKAIVSKSKGKEGKEGIYILWSVLETTPSSGFTSFG